MNKLQHTSASIIILATALLFVTSSCCTKKYCPDWFWVELHGYTATELDTILFYQYSKNTNYSVLIDSTRLKVEPISGIDYYLLPIEPIDPAYDYKFYVTSVGRTYKISEIMTKKESCNSCFMILPKDRYAKIISFQLDGKIISGQRAKLYK